MVSKEDADFCFAREDRRVVHKNGYMLVGEKKDLHSWHGDDDDWGQNAVGIGRLEM